MHLTNALAAFLLFLIIGCDRVEPSIEPSLDRTSVPDDPLARMRLAVHDQDWQAASRLSNAVLTRYHDDADAISLVARIAHKNEKPNVAADLMIDACHAESYDNSTRLEQTMAALLAVGRLHECMDVFDSALQLNPDNHKIRRILYDMCWGTEDRPRAIPHGQILVRERQFDLLLLLSLSNTESRTDGAKTFVEIASRNSRDNRPLVAEAKLQIGRGNFKAASKLLHSVLDLHPNHLPALALLCRVLIDLDDYENFALIAQAEHEGIEEYPEFWLAMGDWCLHHQQTLAAARAYWEATQRDADIREAWLKLSTSLKQSDESSLKIDAVPADAIDRRVLLLTRFSQTKSRFENSGRNSRAIIVEIAEILRDLGRLWEAEAWSSIAMTLPEDKSVSVESVRTSIINLLSKTTPWQNEERHPELKINLSNLPMPHFESDSMVSDQSKNLPATRVLNSYKKIRLSNEAQKRGLIFFGRTGDRLDRPGIQHYQTLGCGGGAIDFDLDGWCDLYLAAAGGTPPNRDSQSNALFRNLEGSFVDVTTPANSGDTGFSQGIAVGDVNEDGFSDLLVLNYGPNTLLINNGDGTFSDTTDRLGVDENKTEWSSSAAIADIDGDGLADLTVLTYGTGSDPVTHQCRHPVTKLARACSPLYFPGAADHILKNEPTGHFTDMSSRWNFAPSIVGRGLGITAGSFDTEPGIDIFIANDLTSNHYWSRSDTKQFQLQETAVLRGLGSDDHSPAQGSMGIATGDLDRDGDLDLYVTNFFNECNTFHEQLSPGMWRDRTSTQNLYAPTLPMVGFGSETIDLENDGFEELVITNGHVDTYPSENAAPYAQPMQVFRRHSNGGYLSIGDSISDNYLKQSHVGRALWTIDVNRDAQTDMVVTHQTESVALLVNQTATDYKWIELQLVGSDASRDAIGTIACLTNGNQKFTAYRTSGDGYLCSNEQIIRIGLGNTDQDCSVSITWPDGQHQEISRLATCKQWLLVQGERSAFEMK